jgi:uridine kinase
MSFFDLAKVSLAIANSDALCGETKIVTIDGPAGSGKTTLANELAELFAKSFGDVTVIHLDELYEGWDGALDAKLFERIAAWVITPIKNGLPPKYLKYDWHQDRYTSWAELSLTSIVIIEGVGSGHSSLREFVSQAIWVEADEVLLLDRVIERDGEAIRDEMLIWKARERTYFELHNVKKSAHIHLQGQ